MQTTAITPSLIWQVSREGLGLGSFLPPLAFDAVTEKVFFCISVKLLSEKIRQLRWQVTQMSRHGLRVKSSHAGSMFTGRCSINSIQLPSTPAKDNEAQDWYLENFFLLDGLLSRIGLPEETGAVESFRFAEALCHTGTSGDTGPGPTCHSSTCRKLQQCFSLGQEGGLWPHHSQALVLLQSALWARKLHCF